MFPFRKKKQGNPFLERVITVGIVALIICTVICTLHVMDVKTNFETETKQNIENYLLASVENLSDYMEQSMQTLDQAVDAVTENGKKPTIESLLYILGEYGDIADFSQVVFVDNNGTVFFSDGTVQKRNNPPKEELDATEKRIKLFKEHGLGTAAYIVPVMFEEEQLGEIVGLQSLTNMLNGYDYEYLNEIGDTFLVDIDGEILTGQSERFASKLQNDLNVFDLLRDYASQDVEAIDYMQKDLNNNTISREVLHTDEGNLYVTCQQISGVENCYLVHCYQENVFHDRAYPVKNRSIAAVLIIVITMTSFLVYMYFCMKKNMNTIEKLAYEDPITKGKNLNYFTERAARTISENRGTPFAIIRFDISNFRYINESYGHVKADELLTIVSMEGGKEFKGKELCVRMNADQFVVLIKKQSDYTTTLQKFVDNINIHAIEAGILFPIKLKWGIYQLRSDDRDIELMIDRANVARRSLGGSEKEFIAFYSDKIISDMRRVDEIESNMEKALVNGEFKVFLQPKWNISEDKLYGAEALVRWVKPDGTMIPPDQFIPVFEQNGFVEKLDFYMLTSVCRLIHNLQKAGMPVFPISVNQSRRLWDNPEYVQHVGQILEQYQVPSNMVELEVTETVFFGEQEKMISIIHELKQKEVLLSMDDFGSGYSSLNLLKDVPFDVLKIDREFFSESVTSKTSTWILKKIIEMAEGLDIRVLCEGVETKEQVELLKELNCKYVQGFYYSRPLSMGEFLEKYFGDHIELSDDDGENNTTEE